MMDDDTDNKLEITCEAEKNEIDEPTVSTEEEEEEKEYSDWHLLPDIALHMIYSFLARSDQVNMSLVCPNWSAGFHSPSVWKSFRFALSESMLSHANCPVMKFVRKYKEMFRHVDIEYILDERTPDDMVYAWNNLFYAFLQELGYNKMNIVSVKIRNLAPFFTRMIDRNDFTTYSDVKSNIYLFLSNQNYLRKIELKNFSNCLQDHEEVLDIGDESRNSITYFGLHELRRNISYSDGNEQNKTPEESYLSIISFPKLKTLAIDYSNIFLNTFARQSATMRTFENGQTHENLSTLILYYNGHSHGNDYQGLTSADWQFLKTLCPNLRVKLNFTIGRAPLLEVNSVIVQDMPIVYLYLAHEEFTDPRNDFGRIKLGHLLASIRERIETDLLEYFSVRWLFQGVYLDLTFIGFFKAFRKLTHFRLFITYPARELNSLLDWWTKNKPESLQEVCIFIDGVENEKDYNYFLKLFTYYNSLLKLAGLTVKGFFERR